VTSRIEKDHVTIRLQGIHTAVIDPVGATAEKAVLHNKGGTFSEALVMDAHAPIGQEWHFSFSRLLNLRETRGVHDRCEPFRRVIGLNFSLRP
jgi:hypothetical protein